MGERRKTLNIWLKRTRDKDGVEGSRPRTQKISEAKDNPLEDGPFLGQGHRRKCSPKKENNNVFKKFFFRCSQKNKIKKSPKKQVFLQKKIYKILRIPKLLLFSSREQGNFRGLKASRPRTSKCVLEDSTSVNRMYQNWKTVESWKQNEPCKTLWSDLSTESLSAKRNSKEEEPDLWNQPLVPISAGPAPRGGIPGPCLPNDCLCAPSEDCAPKKLTRSGLLECKSRPKTPKLVLIALEFASKNCFS